MNTEPAEALVGRRFLVGGEEWEVVSITGQRVVVRVGGEEVEMSLGRLRVYMPDGGDA